MCCFSGPVDLSGFTKGYFGEGYHPADIGNGNRRRVHVLGYQNTVASRSGPNCMIIHLPAAGDMGEDNLIDTRPFGKFLDNMVEAVMPRTRGSSVMMSASLGDFEEDVLEFECGIYSIVLARRPTLAAQALQRIPVEKRPSIKGAQLEFYEAQFPKWWTAFCCFNNSRYEEGQPLLWWYEPMHAGRFHFPAIDDHTGGVPDLRAEVEVNHWLVVGSPDLTPSNCPWASRVNYSQKRNIPAPVRGLLPEYVVGRYFGDMMPNADFVVDRSQLLLTGSSDAIERKMLLA